MSEAKKYRVILVHKVYYSYEVAGETEMLARIEAVQRKESGDWGTKMDRSIVEIFDMEVVK